jgi:hypothetical protein
LAISRWSIFASVGDRTESTMLCLLL